MARLNVCVVFVMAMCYVVCGHLSVICRPRERLLSCGGCQKTCDDPAPSCTAVCRTGCYCSDDDEVRNATGHCVKLADCPPDSPAAYKLKTTEPRPAPIICPEDEEYRFCEPCNRTCDNPNNVCPAQCARGCFCKGELLRDADGKCVEYHHCSKFLKFEMNKNKDPVPYRINCGPYADFNKCITCEKTCSNPNPQCSSGCRKGCLCREGYYKSPTGACVSLDQCPKAEMNVNVAHELSVEDCGTDEVYLSCGWCEPSCSEPTPRCPIAVCTRGCLCRPPLLRHHSGRCVAAKDCAPQKCVDPNEEYVCRYGCEGRCDKVTCRFRPRRCQSGCHCRLGLLRDVTGRCVIPAQCSVTANSNHNSNHYEQYVTRDSVFVRF